MPKRRGHGEGTIFQRKDGRWCAAITTGRDASGKLKRSYIYGKTRKEVQEELTKSLRDQQQGLLVDPSRQTVREFLMRWLEDCVKGTAAPKTYEDYGCVVRRHLIPTIGPIQLTKLSPQHLQRLYREKQDSGLTRMVQLIHAVLHRALNQALKWNIVPRNVADAVDVPRVAKKEMRALSPEEAGKFLEAAQDDRLHALYVLTVSTGLRLGEVLGLKWLDTDLDAGTIQVQRALQWGKDGFYFTEPKTARSRRIVMLPAMAVTALKKHRAKQAEERLALGEVWQDIGMVFTSTIGTPLNPSDLRNRSFHKILERAGLPRIRFHDLRHTAASLLLAAGENPKVVQEMLGHSTIRMTMDTYSHTIPSLQKQAAAKMDSILTAASGKSVKA